jgi:hypothetical protein
VKVGNRQAPQQQAQTPPRKGGVCAFTETPSTRLSNIWVPETRAICVGKRRD